MALLRANRQYGELSSAIADLKRENADLREQARQLLEDGETIEELARRELGLIGQGEKLFVIVPGPTPSTSLSKR